MNNRVHAVVRAAVLAGAFLFWVVAFVTEPSKVPQLTEDYEVAHFLQKECPDGKPCDVFPAIERILNDCRSRYRALAATGCRIQLDAGLLVAREDRDALARRSAREGDR